MHALAFGIGTQEIILILVIVVILFGATKIPQLGASIGQGIRNFRRGMREAEAEQEKYKKLDAEKTSDVAPSSKQTESMPSPSDSHTNAEQ